MLNALLQTRAPAQVKKVEDAQELPYQLLIHQDLMQLDESGVSPSIRKRVNLVLRHLSINGTTSVVKFVQGRGRGWRRTPLGGHNGCHFYLWWAPAGTPPVARLELAEGDIVVRSVRHHDDTDEALDAGETSDLAGFTPPEILDRSFDVPDRRP